MDATYRSDFRELFHAHFTAFDAKLEQRISEVRGELRGVRGELREEIAGLRVDMHGMEGRLTRWMVATSAGTIGVMIALLRPWG